MPKDKKAKIPESKLIKALAELEGVAKGDPLENQDPEGGLSTEGEPLSDAAPSGRGEKTKKSRAGASSPFGASSSSSSSDASSDDDDGGDSVSSPPLPKKKGKKKVSKAAAPPHSSSSSGSSSSSDDDDDDDSDDTDKSFREMAEGDETLVKGLLVNEFLGSMVDQLSLALLHVKDGVTKSLGEMESRLAARIDDRVAKSAAGQNQFNARLAKAIAAIGNTVQDDLLGMVDMVKALADQPVSAPRGKAILSKGDVNQPPWSGGAANADQRAANGSDVDFVEELRGIPTKAINDWLFKKSATNQLDQNVILAFEADHYDPALLPSAVRKALVDDLVK